MQIPAFQHRYLVALLFVVGQNALAAETKAPGVKVPAGFEVTLYADDDLAHDIYSMTIDSKGHVVVSGPGYVRILIDSDGDGTADKFKQFADGPKSGAQGLYFYGNDLLCTGDGGLIRYHDGDGDGRADGPPDTFLKLKTGSEHHAHAVRRGPDGWWYLIAGNLAGISDKYVTLKTSPVRHPQAGTILRLKPDLSGGEIFAHGMRNAYDFAFNAQGDVFTYDSDGERDVSLPWYRPTRVFHLLPATHAGWVSRSWKRPGSYFDMPPKIGAFGRGSPTGVACYRHTQFPAKYHNAIFALDWTFGRVLALPLVPNGATYQSKPFEFMSGSGEFGFAPTDIAVGTDGSLYVCVGGRGTRGGVYRIRYRGEGETRQAGYEVPDRPARVNLNVWRCLTAPQPLSSWSRAQWVPKAKKAGWSEFFKIATDDELPDPLRVRAIEIMTELFDGLDAAKAKHLTAASPAVAARAIWSYGRFHAERPDPKVVLAFLSNASPIVRRAALETLLGCGPETDFTPLIAELAKLLGEKDRSVRLTAANVVSRMPAKATSTLRIASAKLSTRAFLACEIGRVKRMTAVDTAAIAEGLSVLERKRLVEEKRDAIRLMQLALGDLGPRDKRPPAFDSYASRLDLKKIERQLDACRIQLAEIFPTGDEYVDAELARVIAMLSPFHTGLLKSVLAKITDTSHPVRDIHYLAVAARIPAERATRDREPIVQALVHLDAKVRKWKLKQDSHWDERVGEIYAALANFDESLPLAIARHPEFGQPGHILFLKELADKHWPEAIGAIAKRITADRDYTWTTDTVFLLGESGRPEHLELVRKQYSNFGLRDAVLLVLASKPGEVDRGKFVKGLQSGQINVITACEKALAQLPAQRNAREEIALFKAARRLGRDKAEIPVRDALVQQLQKRTGQKFGYKPKADGKLSQSATFDIWEQYLRKTYPDDARTLLTSGGEEIAKIKSLLQTVDWQKGNVERGRELYRKRSCAQCHGERRALGPDLAGVAGRFSRDDFFTAVLQPSRDVSPRYQTTQIVTTQGRTYIGLVVYDSIDGVTLRTGQNQTIRIEADKIDIRRRLNTSLMPVGLLKDLKPQDFADLYAYVRSLSGRAKRK